MKIIQKGSWLKTSKTEQPLCQSKGRHGVIKPQPSVVPGDTKMKPQHQSSCLVILTAVKLILQLFTDECECSRRLGLIKRPKNLLAKRDAAGLTRCSVVCHPASMYPSLIIH